LSADVSSQTDYRAGVGIVLCNPRGLIFTGKRRDRRDPPWQMPQGGVQEGETPAQAAMREIGEEIGTDRITLVEFRPDWLSYDYPDAHTSRRAVNFRGQRHLWFLARFDGHDKEIRIDTPHGEFDDWRWSTPAEVIERVVGFKQPVYRQVMRYFAPTIMRISVIEPIRAKKTPLRRSRQRRLAV
jgi:putative (di)nucleoside polyphosphate hydrolase